MQTLKERILREGKNLGNGILKVDGFINHQVDPNLMDACGREFARRFQSVGATKVLTAEISGIAPALTTAFHLGLPVVYARKHKPITMPDQVYLTLSPSHTKGRMVELIISPEYLAGGERVLIIDDFLASGATILGLARLAHPHAPAIARPPGPARRGPRPGRAHVTARLSRRPALCLRGARFFRSQALPALVGADGSDPGRAERQH